MPQHRQRVRTPSPPLDSSTSFLFRTPLAIRPIGAKLLQVSAQVDQQVAPLFLAAAAAGCAALRDQPRQPAMDALVNAPPRLHDGVLRYAERVGDRRIRLVEQRALEQSSLGGRENDARRL